MLQVLKEFPVKNSPRILAAEDFLVFGGSFSDILGGYFPASDGCRFFTSAQSFKDYHEERKLDRQLLEHIETVDSGEKSFAIYDTYLLVRFTVAGGGRVVGLIFGADEHFLQKVHEDWIVATLEKAKRDFLLIKIGRTDTITGLLNQSNLLSLVEEYNSEKDLHLILVHLPQNRTALHTAHHQTAKAALLVKEFAADGFISHYLGQSIFALIQQADETAEIGEVEQKLVNFLKREGCGRVHVGSSRTCKIAAVEVELPENRILLNQAWTALNEAVKRGPFSFCDYNALANPQDHPFNRSPGHHNLTRKLNRYWKDFKSFSLVRFSSDNKKEKADKVVVDYLGGVRHFSCEGDLYVVHNTFTMAQTQSWAQHIVNDISQNNHPTTVSAGICHYPYGDFKRSDAVMNCKKALLHADFFGPASVITFDGVSLNISGDIYFGEGDLYKAVSEYTKGIDAAGPDVNLYNSLGVTYALMNRIGSAISCFKAALKIDHEDFMALYNLGLAFQAEGENVSAHHYLSLAFGKCSTQNDNRLLIDDLRLQLGILCTETGNYDDAFLYLLDWIRANGGTRGEAKAYKYLGRAYHGAGQSKDAMAAFQRALRHDEFDDCSLSLLGKLYMLEGEGYDIAETLCKKSVELDPWNLHHALNYAEVLIAGYKFEIARPMIQRCLRNTKLKARARLLMAKGYMKAEDFQRAKGWYAKVLSQSDLTSEIKFDVAEGSKICNRQLRSKRTVDEKNKKRKNNKRT